MLATLQSLTLFGLESHLVRVEVDVSKGHPGKFYIVGLGDLAVQEARRRVKSAIRNAGFHYPSTKTITINLAPADLRKEGSGYDIPMALGILIASNECHIPIEELKKSIFIGELALTGEVRHVTGILPIVYGARESGFQKVYLPEVDFDEAALVSGIEILPVKHLTDIVSHFSGSKKITSKSQSEDRFQIITENFDFDMSYIKGQEYAKRALEIAASGGHNVVILCSKTLLAGNYNIQSEQINTLYICKRP